MLLLYKIFARSEEVEGNLAEIVRPHLDAAAQVAGGGGSNFRGTKMFYVIQLKNSLSLNVSHWTEICAHLRVPRCFSLHIAPLPSHMPNLPSSFEFEYFYLYVVFR